MSGLRSATINYIKTYIGEDTFIESYAGGVAEYAHNSSQPLVRKYSVFRHQKNIYFLHDDCGITIICME
jgi:hypothetical protein